MAVADKSSGEVRAWQRMLSGRRLDLLDPSPLDVEIQDIAHGLARVARWNGQTLGTHAYSVAQHSLLVEMIFNRLQPDASVEWQMLALLHDAPEYVIGDMISPFKAVMGGNYKLIEARLESAIHLRFALSANIPAALKKLIKRSDQVAAFFEATLLAGFSEPEAIKYFGRPRGFDPTGLDLTPRPTQDVQDDFLSRFRMLEQKRKALS